MRMENAVDIFKALANEKRLQILEWLKHPEENFGPQGLHIPDDDEFDNSVCVGSISEKSHMSVSTTSNYLVQMQRAGLLESRRFGKWTYYRRNEKGIHELADFIEKKC